jgi:DNA-binding SARP family transcriptional activator
MEFWILGPLEVRTCPGPPCHLTRRKQRLLLATLLLNANRPVPTERLIDWLWAGRPPASATQNLHSYVSNLRRRLKTAGRGGRDPIETGSAGYLLRVGSGELDADRFDELAVQGHDAAKAGRHELAVERLTRALGLWRGPVVLEGLDLPEALQAVTARLEQRRLTVLEDGFAARLATGRHRELVPELEAATRRHPLQERLWAQRMIALYRSGRQGEALAAYRLVRDVLAAEIGVDPGPDLQRLHLKILTADAGLAPPHAHSHAHPHTYSHAHNYGHSHDRSLRSRHIGRRVM